VLRGLASGTRSGVCRKSGIASGLAAVALDPAAQGADERLEKILGKTAPERQRPEALTLQERSVTAAGTAGGQARTGHRRCETMEANVPRTMTLPAVLIAGLLGGCAAGWSDGPVAVSHDITPLPKNYKTIVTDYLKTRNLAVTKIGSAYQDSCTVGLNDKYYGWAVPVSYRTKSARGEASQRIIWLNYNSVQMIGDSKTGACVKA